MGLQAEVQYQCKPSLHHLAAVRQAYKCSADEWQPGKVVQNNSRSKASMSYVTHPLQHFSQTDHVRCSGITCGNVSEGGRNITNLRFAEDIDALRKNRS